MVHNVLKCIILFKQIFYKYIIDGIELKIEKLYERCASLFKFKIMLIIVTLRYYNINSLGLAQLTGKYKRDLFQ